MKCHICEKKTSSFVDNKTNIVFLSLIEQLKNGGYLAIQTQFHDNNEENFKKWYYHQDVTHIVFFTPKTFKILSRL